MNSIQVSIVGSASLFDPEQIKMTQQVGSLLAQNGFSIVCGGLGGVMLEVCRGFKSVESEGSTVGILPSYEATSANEFIDIVIPTGLDVGRNQIVVASGFAVIAIGGGAGTLSEIALASQLNKPVILLKGSGGWADKLTEENLDHRSGAKMHHANSLEQMLELLDQLKSQTDRSGTINSGKHR